MKKKKINKQGKNLKNVKTKKLKKLKKKDLKNLKKKDLKNLKKKCKENVEKEEDYDVKRNDEEEGTEEEGKEDDEEDVEREDEEGKEDDEDVEREDEDEDDEEGKKDDEEDVEKEDKDDEGDEEYVEREEYEKEKEIKRILEENKKYYPHFKIGNIVYARWTNGLLYPGKIVGMYENRVVASIKWEHKEKYENTRVHRDDIYPHIELKVGMEVSAIYNGPDYGNGHSFKAKISSFGKDNMIFVDWDDGGKDYRKIHSSLISPLDIPIQKKKEFKRGDVVLARWYGQDNGYMYPAKVVSIKDEIVVVNWLDGGVTNREVNIKHVVYKHDV